MPTIETIVLFAGAALTLNVTPGPSIAYVMSRSFGQGRTAGLVSALGLGTGSLLHAIAATLGLSAIVTYSPVAYAVVKYRSEERRVGKECICRVSLLKM